MFIPAESVSSSQVVTHEVAIFWHPLAGPWPKEILAIPGFTESSTLFEIFPIVSAAWVWGRLWSGQTVVFGQSGGRGDQKGRFKSLVIMSFVRRPIWLSLQFHFHSHCKFISGAAENVAADAPSRLNYPLFFPQVPEADACTALSPQPSLLRMAIGLMQQI